MRAGCSDGDRKEPYGQERHIATMQRRHTGHVTGTRTGACAWGRSSERAGTLWGYRGQQQTMPQMHAQGCAGAAHRARRAERGPCKGHTGLDNSVDTVCRGRTVIGAKGQGKTHPNQGARGGEKLQRRPKPSTASGDKQ
ncbi:hypothetical protein V6N13_024650 [Hibiscus sabdariffa]|uniref:Uncharacterized protein n=2 Tax=Hibiscus sabdariffa TaxID=183260 RepID=A0ABR2DVT8_9ROSI